jgi:hypothetical protein
MIVSTMKPVGSFLKCLNFAAYLIAFMLFKRLGKY